MGTYTQAGCFHSLMILIMASIGCWKFHKRPSSDLLLHRSMLSCGARLIATVRTLTMGGSTIGCSAQVFGFWILIIQECVGTWELSNMGSWSWEYCSISLMQLVQKSANSWNSSFEFFHQISQSGFERI